MKGDPPVCLASLSLILFARMNEAYAGNGMMKLAKTKSAVVKECEAMQVDLDEKISEQQSLLSSLKLKTEAIKNNINEKADHLVAMIRKKQNAAISELDCKTYDYLDGLEEHLKALAQTTLEASNTSAHIIANNVDEYEVRKLAETLSIRQRCSIKAEASISGAVPFAEIVDRFETSLASADAVRDVQRALESLFTGDAAAPSKANIGSATAEKYPFLNRGVGIIGLGRGSGPGQLGYPNGLALHCSQGAGGVMTHQLFVADWGNNHRIQVFDAVTGEYQRSIGGGNGSMPGKLSGPADIALYKPVSDGETLLFVADCSNHRIQVFNAVTGQYVRTIGEGRGTGPGQLSGPSGIALKITAIPKVPGESDVEPSEDVRLFVADHGNSRVVCFSALTGRYLRLIGAGRGFGPGQLSGPFGLALHQPKSSRRGDPALLFVADYSNNRVQVFDSLTGQFVRSIGAPGVGQLSHPRGLALHDTDAGPQLYVADCGNHRVMVYDAKLGRHLKTIGRGEGLELGQMSCPNGVLVHPGVAGTLLFVAEIGSNRVQVLLV